MWTGNMPRMFGANQGSGERNDQEAVAAREACDLPKLGLVVVSAGLAQRPVQLRTRDLRRQRAWR